LNQLPERLKGAYVSAVIKIVNEFIRNNKDNSNYWRTLYVGVVLSYFLKEKSQSFLYHQLSQSIMHGVDDVFVREDGDGSRSWTIILNFDFRVTISIIPLDNTPESSLACFALSMFIKAFEDELKKELICGCTEVNESVIQVGNISHMPLDIQQQKVNACDLKTLLFEQACVISRPYDFSITVPTIVFLSSTFFESINIGDSNSGALQMLFAQTIVELTYQLLHGEVEMEVLRPKVVSLVKKTMI